MKHFAWKGTFICIFWEKNCVLSVISNERDWLFHSYYSHTSSCLYHSIVCDVFTDNRKFPMHLSQVDRLTFKYPPFPLLSQPESVPPEMLCSDGCQHLKFCECLHIVRAPVNVTLDVVLVDEGMLLCCSKGYFWWRSSEKPFCLPFPFTNFIACG